MLYSFKLAPKHIWALKCSMPYDKAEFSEPAEIEVYVEPFFKSLE